MLLVALKDDEAIVDDYGGGGGGWKWHGVTICAHSGQPHAGIVGVMEQIRPHDLYTGCFSCCCSFIAVDKVQRILSHNRGAFIRAHS